MFAALVLGNILIDSGFQSALNVQIPLLFILMLIPFFVLEKEGDSRFLGGTTENSQNQNSSMNFGELKDGLLGVLKESSTRWALLLAAIVGLVAEWEVEWHYRHAIPIRICRGFGMVRRRLSSTQRGHYILDDNDRILGWWFPW